jgi:hypothetical protein
LSSDSIFACCVGFVVSRCVLKEHPPTHLGRGHHRILFCVFGGEIGTTAEYFARNFTAPIHPPLVAVFGASYMHVMYILYQ